MWTSSRRLHLTSATSCGWRIVTAAPETVWLALGTNLGDRETNLRAALAGLAVLGRISRISSVYETQPVGYLDQPDFWNLVLALETSLSPHALHEATLEIERRLGRVTAFRNAPRVLDIDVLLHGSSILSGALEIPHPRMLHRAFVLVPLVEIAAELRHPVSGATMREALEAAGPLERVRAIFPGERLLTTETGD